MAKGVRVIIFLIAVLLILVPTSQAVGIAATRYELDYVPSTTVTLNYWAINIDNVTRNYLIQKDGDLKDYITLYTDEITVPARSVKEFKVNVTHPAYLAPGKYLSIIKVIYCEADCAGTSSPLIVYASDKTEAEYKEVQKPNIFSAIVQAINFARLSITRESTNIVAVIPTNPANVIELIERVDEDSRVKAIIIEIKPSTVDAYELMIAIEDAQKPVIVLVQEKTSFEELAFLGTADKLVAPPTSIVSSSNLFLNETFWTAAEAKEMGLVDVLGGKHKAKELAAELAGVSKSKLINFGSIIGSF